MKKIALTELLDFAVDDGSKLPAIEVSGVNQDSRRIQSGDLFLACAGVIGNHGIAYGGEAAKNGAIAIAWEPTEEVKNMPQQFPLVRVGEKNSQNQGVENFDNAVGFRDFNDKENAEQKENVRSIPLIKIDDLHEKVGLIAAKFYAHPSKKMNVVGVTGTNGKTSIAFFIAQCLSQKSRCGVLGTIGNGVFSQSLDKIKESSLTTADPLTLQKMLAEMSEDGVKHLAMEVSSHAIDQKRIEGIDFNIAVFTNLSRDHLDYHGDMKSYAATKQKLFTNYGVETSIINGDDPFGRQIIDELKSRGKAVLSYSTQNAQESDIRAIDIQAIADGIRFKLIVDTDEEMLTMDIKVALVGDFNVSNVLATCGVLWALGCRDDELGSLLNELSSVPGRMQLVERAENYTGGSVVIDYAHTPDALEQALKALQEHRKALNAGEIWCVFGCGGDRDTGKRPMMGRIAEQYAQHIILTNDNPRTEQAIDIIRDIEGGFSEHANYQVEPDRKSAIKSAMSRAAPNDFVLIAGKGHETYQEVNGVKHYFSDLQVVLELMGKA